MKTTTVIALLAVGVVAQTLAAADMYLVNLRGTCYSRGDLKPTATRLTTDSILEHHSAILPEPIPAEDLRLVYRPDADRISIVTTNGTIVCEYLIFALPTGNTNSVGTYRERHVFVYSEASSISIGSGSVTERLTHNGPEGTVDRYAMTGTLQFTQRGTEETGPEVCNATFKTGKKLVLPVAAGPTP